LDEGGFVATSPDVPGLVAEGRSIVEATEIAQGLARKIVESCLDHGDPIPPSLAKQVGPGGVDFSVPIVPHPLCQARRVHTPVMYNRNDGYSRPH
jgi:predicted RNase H-like HicB family nuclease